ncbi:FAD-binding oxidoreductase [Enterovirga rhinocerotis]|uniref:Alkyldihydroxyacetonephosphate synthase n=1 Tax=Enterovirga rhinocerotis TaxID=1339210 RepID=A0A4R7BTD9_9HYPH|nr:FAD-binding oxidoreductase [Enterovirga rhinocerotis]TDR89014.1 alkyldihydroxyacetonephosphate synthase [Enterovirga rhinocerotis]
MSAASPQTGGPAASLAAVVGPTHVSTDAETLTRYARDRLPFGIFRARSGGLPGTMPAAVAKPASEEEIVRLVESSARDGFRIIPFGLGSGVLGGTIPLGGEVMLDVTRLDKLLAIDETNGLATVQAGMNGGEFERALNAAGWTCGHLPQSINISTVGGWAACRGGGQASSRYGKIEDIVVGLRAVLPDGRILDVRPVARRAVGPSLIDLLVGSEGTLGIITELTLRIFRTPAIEKGVVLAFPSQDAALNAARRIMQAELRPQVVRIYDEIESRERTKDIEAFRTKPILAIMVFCGTARTAAAEEEESLAICREEGADIADDGPLTHWREVRYESYSGKWQAAGYFMDTIEVCAPWSSLATLYDTCRNAALSICPEMHFGAHWSHVYPEGACQYMTIRLPPMPDEQGLALHARLWDAIESATLDCGGTVAHHHGAGVFRNPWLKRELGTGLDVLQAIKDALDPDNRLNPGKLGLRPAAGAVEVRHG